MSDYARVLAGVHPELRERFRPVAREAQALGLCARGFARLLSAFEEGLAGPSAEAAGLRPPWEAARLELLERWGSRLEARIAEAGAEMVLRGLSAAEMRRAYASAPRLVELADAHAVRTAQRFPRNAA